MNYYLAIDIGASSGRHMLGHLENDKLVFEEVHRFSNGSLDVNGTKCWDTKTLFQEIILGMQKCKQLGKIPTSVGIDTWAVDFVLLDEEDQMVGESVCYRDHRTDGMDVQVSKVISSEALYQRTGIQKQIFNTIYQLMAVKTKHPKRLGRAKTFLMIPDYFHFLLSGKKACEYTNATTTQLINPITNDWDNDLLMLLGLEPSLFPNIYLPGTILGNLTDEIAARVGYTCKVVLPATHDTASAVMAIPSVGEPPLYISSGTWSLMGTERFEADCSPISMQKNFTNEGGYEYRYRFLKNIMGLWMIQSVKKEIGKELSFDEICKGAAKETISSIVDCNDNRFLAPKNMTYEVQSFCRETNQEIPEGLFQVAAVIYHSLAECYAKTVQEIEEICHTNFTKIHIVGGGANADYLNQLTAYRTKKTILAGPTEATAVGNLVAQMISNNELENLVYARKCILNSFEIKEFN